MSGFSFKGLTIPFLLVLLVMCSTLDICDAGRGWDWRAGDEGKSGGGSSPTNPSQLTKPKPRPIPSPTPKPKPQPSPSPIPPAPHGTAFDVLDFGAKGDGTTDDTKAFQAAWAAACEVEASRVVVPSKYEFLVGPVSFDGPTCQDNIVFQLDGTIIAPTDPKPWGSGLLQWLEFRKLRGLTIQGQGIIEGQGNAWWSNKSLFDDNAQPSNELSGKMPHTTPTALRLYGSNNVTVTGITIRNSPQCHLKFDSCDTVEVSDITISSPGDSPNTDGIHLQDSLNVFIHDVDLGCGDDCISIQTGCSSIYMHNINCGPGHGISIGGLGKDNAEATVSNITVQGANMDNTLTAVRIKTWQGGSGYVKNIRFANVKVSEVQTPIIIDQFYCDSGRCKNQSSAVALSEITYEGIRGTYTVQPVHLACSDNIPCSNIHLNDIELELLNQHEHVYEPFCWQAYGELQSPTEPPINCLHSEKLKINQIHSDQGSN
ncbi:polygalacturonase At1g48100 [Elaeis guineensis]|uniref:Polygalacturonase At1g48100 n=1 Tax=Elaeis guineensis var. tenera TaxID=51953 RepID=A0A6I9S2V8_ELAGV|nr:polygalacturonase At1g48100 [Elaeis guineensis]